MVIHPWGTLNSSFGGTQQKGRGVSTEPALFVHVGGVWTGVLVREPAEAPPSCIYNWNGSTWDIFWSVCRNCTSRHPRVTIAARIWTQVLTWRLIWSQFYWQYLCWSIWCVERKRLSTKEKFDLGRFLCGREFVLHVFNSSSTFRLPPFPSRTPLLNRHLWWST